MSLRLRLALVALAVLAATLAAVAGLAFQLSRVQGRAAVDRALRQELDDLTAALPQLLADRGAAGAPTTADLAVAVERHLAVNPGSDQHLTVVTVGPDRLTTRSGPEAVLELLDGGLLPAGRPGELRTTASPAGPLRILTAALEGAGGTTVGQVEVVGPLADVDEDAREALARISIAGAIGLLVGGLALVAATSQALRPLGRLAEAARATDVDDLTVRVPEPARRDEVGTVAHEYNRMLDRLAAEAERRTQLLAAISHELRTPVAVARGHLDVFAALGPDDHTDARSVGQVVAAELERLSRLIDDLSAVAHGGAAIGLERDPVFLPDLFAALRGRVAALGLDATTTVAEPPPLVLEADADRLTQALLNLVLNAAHHTPPGTAVTVTARRDGGEALLSVADDGTGVDPALEGSVFEPFVSGRRGGPSRTTGLGLSVVRALTEAHDGRVELASTPAGTEVTLRLPLPAPV